MGGTPHGVQHLFVGHNLAGVPRKKSQEFELLRREPHLLAVATNAAARDVNLQSVDPDDWGLAGALHSMTEGRAEPSHELPDPERLVDEIVGAAVESGNFLRFAVARREDDDRHVRPLAHAPDHVLPVDVRQAEIEHHHVGHFGCDAPERFAARVGAQHLIIVREERRSEKAVDRGLIVHNEDSSRCAHGGDPCSGSWAVTRVPRPFAIGLATAITPWWASTIPFAMARPRPVPSPASPAVGARTNFSKTRGSTSAGIPWPSSVTQIAIQSISRRAASMMCAVGPA